MDAYKKHVKKSLYEIVENWDENNQTIIVRMIKWNVF